MESKAIVRLSAEDRKSCLAACRCDPRVIVAMVLLLLDAGYGYRVIARLGGISYSTISRIKKAYLQGGVEEAFGQKKPPPRVVPWWVGMVVRWVTELTPRGFGVLRWRWTCGLLAWVLGWKFSVTVSAETVRRHLHQAGLVWRRPRPVLGRKDPEYEPKIAALRELLARLPPGETAVFEDEVELHLCPKVGACWMRRGQQAVVVTPGRDQKCHLAGSYQWDTAQVFVSPVGPRRNAVLFIQHLEYLRQQLGQYRVIHVICDNARFHRCRAVEKYLAEVGGRIKLHFLPTYAPETNPVERVWWHLHEEVTRNHRCQTLEELVDQVMMWFASRTDFRLQTDYFRQFYLKAA